MADPREEALNDAARKIMAQSNYDPHFSAIEERVIMETMLFLARFDALRAFTDLPRNIADAFTPLEAFVMRDAPPEYRVRGGYSTEIPIRSVPRQPEPVSMILFCHDCGVQHIDAPEPHKPECVLSKGEPFDDLTPCTCGAWTNPPHTSHLCHYCGHIFRPTDVPTYGVKEIATRGKGDSPAVRGHIDRTSRFRPQWRHKEDGSVYMEIARGVRMGEPYTENRMVAYRGEDNKVWFRLEKEFDDGRFEKL